MDSQDMVPAEMFYKICDRAHALFASTVVLGFNFKYGLRGAIWSAITVAAWAILKEGIFDNLFETRAVRGSGIRDAVGYFLGASLAMALIYF